MKNSLYQRIESYSSMHALIPTGSSIIIGLSGGPDSVFLLHYLASRQKELSLTLIAAHLDHGWRADSAHDVQFCHSLAQSFTITFISKKLADLEFNCTFNGSQEEIGRKARRHFFQMVKKEHAADLIALAHHAQDQQETFFIRLLRGASLSGLVGMKPKDGVYIRPLLESNKQEIVDYLQAHNSAYLIDPSNVSDAYLRNRIRSSVIPALTRCDARFNENFASTHARLKDTEEFLNELTHKTYAQISCAQDDKLLLDISKLLEQHSVMQYRIIVHWLIANQVPFPPSQSFFDEIIRFTAKATKKEHQLHHDWKIVKIKNWISIQTHYHQ